MVGGTVKWFKHYANAEYSESLSKLESIGGFEALGRYWRFIEFLCREFDGGEPHFRIERSKLRGLFRFRSWNDLESFSDHLAIIPGIKVERLENVYEIKAPILLELQSRDFKKARNERGMTAPKNKIKNKIKNKSISMGSQQNASPQFSHPSDLQEFINLFNQELKDHWLSLYPDESWINRELEKAYGYFYIAKTKRPSASFAAWNKRMSSWLAKGWESYTLVSQPKKQSKGPIADASFAEIFVDKAIYQFTHNPKNAFNELGSTLYNFAKKIGIDPYGIKNGSIQPKFQRRSWVTSATEFYFQNPDSEITNQMKGLSG